MRYQSATILVFLLPAPLQVASAQWSAHAVSRTEHAFAYFPVDAAEEAPDATSTAAALPFPKYGRWVSVTKWATLGVSIGLGAYGFKLNTDANDIFIKLEIFCESDPDNCRSRNPDGSYTDPLLESIYQDALDKDNRARSLLIASQLLFGVTVVLFIVDFQRAEGPENVPYEPEEDEGKNSLQITAVPGTITLRYYIQ